MSKAFSLYGRLAALLLAALLFGVPAYAAEPTSSFSDVPADVWYAEAVEYVRAHGLMAGTSPDTFLPDGVMTRAMLVTVLYRAAGSPELSGGSGNSAFSDVAEDAWYASGVSWAREMGITGGYGDGRFGPNDPVTREQLAAILWRYAGSPEAETAALFADREGISPWAVPAADWAASAGVMAGVPGNLFAPDGQATRAQAAVVLARYDQQDGPEAPEPEEPGPVPAPEPEPVPTPDPEPEQPSVTLQPNRYDPHAFVVENGFLAYQGGTPSYVGVDVSAHQDWIDWERVAAAGIDFAMIRVGYRGYTAGQIYEDPYWEHNIAGALNAGLDVGIYFFSQATSEAEAREEAAWTLAQIAGYDITYPVVFDWERVSGPYSRTSSTTGATVTACARVFCQMVEDAGYTAMTYGSPSKVGTDLDLSQLAEYPFWLAHYTTGWRPTSFRYHYDMWQYSSHGSVDGISGRVDLDICLVDW